MNRRRPSVFQLSILSLLAFSSVAVQGAQKRIDLREYEREKAARTAALAAETNADVHAKLAFDYAKYLYACGQEEIAACEGKMRDAYDTPGIKPATKLAFLKEGVPGLTYLKDGFAVAEASKDETLLNAWYLEVTRFEVRLDRRADPLDPANCDDWRLRKCDEAIARLGPRFREQFKLRKAQFLRRMSRWDEAESLYRTELDAITNTASRVRAKWYGLLAELCVDRSARYYLPPDAAWTAKAVGFWREALKVDPKNAQPLRRIVERAMFVEDYALAEKALGEMTGLMRDGKPDAWMTAVYGDIAYFRGDYEQAVKWYSTYPKFPDAPARIRIPNSHQRFVGALHATGRYEECLKAIDSCPNFWSFRDVNENYRRILREKIRARCTADLP